MEVHKAIGKLNNNKAADKRGLMAEHLKQAVLHILHPLSDLFTNYSPQRYSTIQLQYRIPHSNTNER